MKINHMAPNLPTLPYDYDINENLIINRDAGKLISNETNISYEIRDIEIILNDQLNVSFNTDSPSIVNLLNNHNFKNKKRKFRILHNRIIF